MKLAKPDDFSIVVVGSPKEEWLREQLAEEIQAGRVSYLDREAEEDREAASALLGDDAPEAPVAFVMNPGAEEGEACVLSAIGESIIVHCEDQVIPLRGHHGD